MQKHWLLVLLILIAGSVMGGNVTLRGTTDCDDTYVADDVPTINFGISNYMKGGSSDSGKQALIRFDLSGIPVTATVDSVHLFFVNLSANQTWKWGKITTRWAEGTENNEPPIGGGEWGATWNYANDSTTDIDWTNSSNWSTQDLDSNGGSWYGSAVSETGTGNIEFYGGSGSDLVSCIQDWVTTPSTNYGGWLGKPNTTESPVTIRSTEYATEAQRPLLYVEYTEAGGATKIGKVKLEKVYLGK